MKNNDRFLASSTKPATVVFDKGRRGNPLAGCDCVQCFGYCMINGDEAARVRFAVDAMSAALLAKVEGRE